MNGVHRVADRLVREIDAMALVDGEPAGWDMRLLVPHATNWAPAFDCIRAVPQRAGHSQVWEQAVLPFAARGGILVSLANLAPALHPAKVTMVHDAQFRLSPASYPARLRLGYRLLVPAGARTSRRVLTVSDYARDSLETFGIARRDLTSVVYNSADHMAAIVADNGVLDRLDLRGRRFCLLFGSVAQYKNIGVVLNAFRDPRLADIDLVIVGGNAAGLAAAGLAPPLGTRFAGAVSDEELRALYNEALCLAFPSRTEGFGLPPLEAMICGCPVVAAPAGAMPEVCRDAVLYASASSVDEWAASIVRLAQDPALRIAKIVAGRARAGDFSWAMAGRAVVAAISATIRRQA